MRVDFRYFSKADLADIVRLIPDLALLSPSFFLLNREQFYLKNQGCIGSD